MNRVLDEAAQGLAVQEALRRIGVELVPQPFPKLLGLSGARSVPGRVSLSAVHLVSAFGNPT